MRSDQDGSTSARRAAMLCSNVPLGSTSTTSASASSALATAIPPPTTTTVGVLRSDVRRSSLSVMAATSQTRGTWFALPLALALGHLDAEFALGVCSAERPQGLSSLIEAVGALDGHPQGAGVQQLSQALKVLRARHRHDVDAPSPVAGRAVQRDAATTGLESCGVGVEAIGGVGDEVEEGVDAFWVALVHKRGDVGIAIEHLADAKVSQIFLVLGQCGCDHCCAGVGGELDGEATHTAVGSYHQDGVAF